MTAVISTDETKTPTEATRGSTKRRKKSGAYRLRILALQIGVFVAGVGLWEFGAGRWFSDFFTSRPSAIAELWWEWLVTGELWYHASSTLSSSALGFLLGGVIAIIAGYVLGAVRWLADVCEPFITAGYTLPKVALVPLFVLWFGIGQPLEVAVSGVITFFLMFYNVYFGVREVDRNLIDAVRVMGGGGRDIALRVRFPSALVWVVAGLKVSVPQALVGVVVAELLASNRGLGFLVGRTAGQFNAGGTFAAILTLLIIGVLVDGLVALITRRALLWKDG